MVVEDDPTSRGFYRSLLIVEGFEVVAAGDGFARSST
jgi:DNA-binding response OmpR family regulator